MSTTSGNKKVAIVTGGSRGIGLAIVQEFAKHGYSVAYCHRGISVVAGGGDIKADFGTDVKEYICDISQEKQVLDFISKVVSDFGHIDVLVNNAGVAIDKEFDERTPEDFQETMNINVIGTWLMSRAVACEMLKQHRGKIINIVSTNGLDTVFPESIDYDASKAAMINMTYNFAKQYAPHIKVNAVAPGWTNTEMNKNLPTDFLAAEQERILLKRFAEPAEVARVVLFLAGPDADYITSTVIKVDGKLGNS